MATTKTTLVAVAGGSGLLALGFWLGRRTMSSVVKEKPGAQRGEWRDPDLRFPPFPREIVSLLDSASLCYLSTTMNDMPHLSLMNFTFDRTTQTIIFTTRRDTQKCRNFEQNARVAILIHDFPADQNDDSAESDAAYDAATYSITLYGTAKVLVDGDEAEVYRERHLQHSSPQSAVFIRGEGIAVVVVCVKCARLCDSQDKVVNWDVRSEWARTSGSTQ